MLIISFNNHPFSLQIPTPQVTMGACFVTVLQCSPIQVNCCTQWFHPANQRQFMVIGAEQGIFAMDLSGADEESPLIQVFLKTFNAIKLNIHSCMNAVALGFMSSKTRSLRFKERPHIYIAMNWFNSSNKN